MKKLFINIICSFICLSAFAQASELRFHNGKFKILQLTDLHWIVSDSYSAQNDSTCHLIREAIRIEHPDLIVLTGDVVVSWNAKKGWETLANLFEETQTPFAVTFGNHDEETDMSNDDVLAYLSRCPYNLTYDADKKLPGSGNCTLAIHSSNDKSEKWMLYLFDSHNTTKNRSLGYYDWIKHDQIQWYRETSDKVSARNHHTLPSLAFLHIPLPEYETARWVCHELGEKKEGVCSSRVNSGLFSAFMEEKDVIGIFAGHDHNNDYIVDLNGNIALAYGRKTGYPAAYNEKLSRGVRVINLHENEPSFDTYIRDLNGTYFHYTFEQKNAGTDTPRFSGSFIQEYLVVDWNDERWNQEMEMLKEAGMKYLVYAPSLLVNSKGTSSANYPSSLTKKRYENKTLEKCLRSAQKNQIKVFVGLNFNERWWKVDYDADWLIDQMNIGNMVADELVSLYKENYPDAMYGWYWVWEVDNLNCMTPDRQSVLANALNTNLDHLSEITPEMPFMLSPFMNHKVGADAVEYGEMWKRVFAQAHFRPGDIFAPQDCIGAGGLDLNNLWKWFSNLKKAVNTKPGLKFWGNVETFDQRFWVSAPLERVKKQLDIVNEYVSNIVCFTYNHYYSPYVVNRAYHKAYLQYCKDGTLPDLEVPQRVVEASSHKVADGIKLEWTPGEVKTLDGYSIYRDGELICRLQIKDGKLPLKFVDHQGNINNRYEIAAYNVIGTESERIEIKQQ